MNFTRTVVLEQGGTGWGEDSIDLLGGADVGRGVLGLATQIALAMMLAACLAWLWRSDAAFELKASALASGSLLRRYVLDYDLVVLAVAIAYLARQDCAAASNRSKSACWPRRGWSRCCRAAWPE